MEGPLYLAQAKEQVDKAVVAFEAGVRPEGEIDQLLRDASASACEALNRFYGDEDHWKRVSQKKQSDVLLALREIIKKKDHFDQFCLPVSADALRKFGFKPPEDAEKVVSEARQACAALTEVSCNLVQLAVRARESVKKLADVTCRLARELRERAERGERWKRLRQRTAKVFKWVGATLAGALLSHAVDGVSLDRNNMPLSNPGQAAIQLVATKAIEDNANRGVEEGQRDSEQDEHSAADRGTTL